MPKTTSEPETVTAAVTDSAPSGDSVAAVHVKPSVDLANTPCVSDATTPPATTTGAAGAVTPTSNDDAGSPGDALIVVMPDTRATFSFSPCLW